MQGADQVGGFAGFILKSYNTRDVYSMGAVSGADEVGGLVGYIQNGGLSTSFATGYVHAQTVNQGGLVGAVDNVNDLMANSYFNTQTTGQSVGVRPSGGIFTGPYLGVAGQTTAQLQSSLPAGFGMAAWGTTGAGLYPYLTGIFASTPQAIAGAASTDLGAAAAGGEVALYQGGALLGYGTVSVGADGSFYDGVAPGTLAASGVKIGATLTLSGASAVSGSTYTDAGGVANNVLPFGNIASASVQQTTTRTAYSGLQTDLDATFGSPTTRRYG